jgi:hypothetical protein
VSRIHVEGLAPTDMSGEEFRLAIGRSLGWQHIKSTAFDLQRTGGGYRVTGRGLGHGVGLCMTGAARMAERGRSRRDILAAYFPGTREVPFVDLSILHTDAEAVRIVLPAADESERPAVRAIVASSLAALQRSTGADVPGRVQLRFHPTVESYRRATGRSWWTSAATDGATIHVIPLESLRARGTLETTIRHELAHVFTDATLSRRPLWVREGAAMYFAGERLPAASPDCPPDRELLRARSETDFRDAYARAGQCFAREIARGTDWTDVGSS